MLWVSNKTLIFLASVGLCLILAIGQAESWKDVATRQEPKCPTSRDVGNLMDCTNAIMDAVNKKSKFPVICCKLKLFKKKCMENNMIPKERQNDDDEDDDEDED